LRRPGAELFGHLRGAFTGADRDRAGIFEAAEGGTVLLDEIGDLPLDAQGKLLRLLQEGEVRRLGESLPREVDVRVVAATHRNLERMTEKGEFRMDLYYRLRVGRVELPPLRDRGDDVLLLAKAFLASLGYPPPRLSAAAWRRLREYHWPGNVRELKNVLEVAAALSDDGRIGAELLDLPDAGEPLQHGYHERLRRFRRSMVAEALDASDGNQSAAARRLGLSRQALSYLVRRLEIR
jgi:sigma-54-dependent transcriptional regulator